MCGLHKSGPAEAGWWVEFVDFTFHFTDSLVSFAEAASVSSSDDSAADNIFAIPVSVYVRLRIQGGAHEQSHSMIKRR